MNTQTLLNSETLQIFKASIPSQITQYYGKMLFKYLCIIGLIYMITRIVAKPIITYTKTKHFTKYGYTDDDIKSEINFTLKCFIPALKGCAAIVSALISILVFIEYTEVAGICSKDKFYEITQEINIESEEFKRQVPDIPQFFGNQELYKCEFEKLSARNALHAGFKTIEIQNGEYIYKEIAPKSKYLEGLDTNRINMEELQKSVEENAIKYIKNVQELRKFVDLDKTDGSLIHNECKENVNYVHCKAETKKPEEKQESKEQPKQEEVKEQPKQEEIK